LMISSRQPKFHAQIASYILSYFVCYWTLTLQLQIIFLIYCNDLSIH
jgi:hypothetical protein